MAPPTPAPLPELAIIASDPAVAAIGNPTRRALLQALAAHPDSASGLAQRVNTPRQRVNYHLKALEKAKLVELALERPRRGLIERVFRTTAKAYAIDPSVLGHLDAGAQTSQGDRWSSGYAIALASRAIREITALDQKARRQKKRLATASFDATINLATPAAMADFVTELSTAIAVVIARHNSSAPQARTFRVTTSAWPTPTPAHPATHPDISTRPCHG